MTRSELINLIIKQNDYKKYLEIGVNTPAQPGWNFDNINTEIKHGVDPNVDTTFKITSDKFFKKHIQNKYDIIFIDGLHIFEQVYKDIINSLIWLEKDGTIVVHDCNPTEEITQRRKRASNAWHGDVWKAILKLRIENPNIQIYTVDTDEGCSVIRKGSQKLFEIENPDEDIYNYKFFDKNREKILNLISVDEFKKIINTNVIIKLQGGLGNQMFQYALGQNIAISNKVKVKLDLSFFEKHHDNTSSREYSLDCFNINREIATKKEIKKLTKFKEKKGRQHFFHNTFIANKSIYIKEKEIIFDKKILEISNSSIYLDGYWQSEKHFKDIEDILRKEFTLKEDLSSRSQETLLKIKSSNSVSIHIRREDYINNKTHNSLSIEYYEKAIKIITNKIKNPTFFIFSDDIEWVKKNLKTNFPIIFVEGNKDYEDLTLMSNCKHNIIANSSFSWWGAWLNKNPNKIVIAPKRWFNNSEMDTKDLIPQSWLKI